MSTDPSCKRFLQIIAKHSDHNGQALRATVKAEYGEDWLDPWNYAHDHRYLDRRGEKHLFKLTRAGRRAAGI
jgi:hypothetical protein